MPDLINAEAALSRWGIDATTLKLIAIVGMTLNHIGHVFGAYLHWLPKTLLFMPGGLTFPIMAYLMIEGYKKTRDVKRYMLRLFIFALVSFMPFWWALTQALNVMFTLLAGLIVLYLSDRIKQKWLFSLMLIAITMFTVFCDWGLIGVPLLYSMYAIKDEKQRLIKPLLCIAAVIALMALSDNTSDFRIIERLPDLSFAIGCLCAIPLLLSYNGERGRGMTHLFYIFYPAHMVVLGFARGILFNIW